MADNGLSKHTKFIQSMLCTCTYMYICMYVCIYVCVCDCDCVTVCVSEGVKGVKSIVHGIGRDK